MSGFSNAYADSILDDMDGSYIGLFVGDPTDTGAGGTEVTDDLNGRVAISLGPKTTDGDGRRSAANDAVIDFGDAEATTSGEISHWALFGAASGGVPLWTGSLTTAKPVTAGDPVRFPPGAFVLAAR